MKRIRVRKQAQHNALVALCCILSLLRHFITAILERALLPEERVVLKHWKCLQE